MHKGLELNSPNKPSPEEIKKDILLYVEYCKTSPNFKEKEIVTLISKSAAAYGVLEANSKDLFINKIVTFQIKLRDYSSKKDKDGFNKAFLEVFPGISYAENNKKIRRLMGLLLNRNSNKGYQHYKQNVYIPELLVTLNTENLKGVERKYPEGVNFVSDIHEPYEYEIDDNEIDYEIGTGHIERLALELEQKYSKEKIIEENKLKRSLNKDENDEIIKKIMDDNFYHEYEGLKGFNELEIEEAKSLFYENLNLNNL